jgi:hypothetical protein
MDIHKPKPWRGLREFLKEYLIIVVGVLTALGGEQVVERLHERHVAAEARENIRRELAETLARFEKRKKIQPCIAARLDDVARLIRTAGEPGYRPPVWVGRPQVWDVQTARWEAASQAGRSSLFDPEEQTLYSRAYTALKLAAAGEDAEQLAWAHLRALEGEAAPGPALIVALKLALQEARYEDWNIRAAMGEAEDAAAALRLPAGHTDLIGSTSVCLPTTTTRAEALGRISPRWGEP